MPTFVGMTGKPPRFQLHASRLYKIRRTKDAVAPFSRRPRTCSGDQSRHTSLISRLPCGPDARDKHGDEVKEKPSARFKPLILTHMRFRRPCAAAPGEGGLSRDAGLKAVGRSGRRQEAACWLVHAGWGNDLARSAVSIAARDGLASAAPRDHADDACFVCDGPSGPHRLSACARSCAPCPTC